LSGSVVGIVLTSVVGEMKLTWPATEVVEVKVTELGAVPPRKFVPVSARFDGTRLVSLGLRCGVEVRLREVRVGKRSDMVAAFPCA
jgi:hypothetical protein